MTTHLPSSLQHLLEVVVGQPWPEGDEDQLWDMANEYDTFKTKIEDLSKALTEAAAELPDYMQGTGADQFVKWAGTDSPNDLKQLEDQITQLSNMCRNAGGDIRKSKVMIIIQLVMLAAMIAYLIASLFGAFAIPGVIATFRAVIQALVQALLLNLLLTLGMDAAIQGIEKALGQRATIDLKSLEASAISGVVGGLLFGAGSVAGSFLRNGIARIVSNGISNTFKDVV
ncbi:MAG TPA: hypothetical protein VG756_07865, partial [Pseudonocardiaceae bacterium]|nr:hypothetical protein [Pseudonocardiaceae bacterium]